MDRNQEKPKDESQQVSQPAGEARGSDLPPQGQGGPHLPAIEEPTGKSLSVQFERGPVIVQPAEQPAEQPHGTYALTTNPPHRCFVCKGPDHRACGCETKELKRQIEQDDKAFRNRDLLEEELSPEDANAAEVLTESEKAIAKSFDEYADRLDDRMRSVLDGFSDIGVKLDMVVSQLDVIIEHHQTRAKVLEDIQNAGSNKN